jgi:hypothetical protein
VTTVGDGVVPSGLPRSVHFSVVASAMDDEGRPVGVMDDGAGDAAQQHRAHSPEPSGTHHDRRSVVLIGDLDDRLPHRSRGLDGDRFGLQARVSRDTDPSWAATFPASSAAARSSLKKSTMLAVAPAHAKRSRPWVLSRHRLVDPRGPREQLGAGNAHGCSSGQQMDICPHGAAALGARGSMHDQTRKPSEAEPCWRPSAARSRIASLAEDPT